MNGKQTGGCACGAIRFECEGPAIRMVCCHCRECQKASGSAYMTVVVFPKATFRITRGEPAWFAVERTKGGQNRRAFCPTCGSRLFSGGDDKVQGVTASSFDDSTWFKPMGHIFARQAHAWTWFDSSVPKFDAYLARATP